MDWCRESALIFCKKIDYLYTCTMNMENPFGPQPIKNEEEKEIISQENLAKYNSIPMGAEVMYKDPTTGEYIIGVVINKNDETYQVFVGQKGPGELDSSYGVAIPLEDIHLQGNTQPSAE